MLPRPRARPWGRQGPLLRPKSQPHAIKPAFAKAVFAKTVFAKTVFAKGAFVIDPFKFCVLSRGGTGALWEHAIKAGTSQTSSHSMKKIANSADLSPQSRHQNAPYAIKQWFTPAPEGLDQSLDRPF
jgi:hypothetical protein